MDAVFKALADASRRSLLDALNRRNGQTLTELAAELDMTRQAVTKHLGILEGANLIVTARDGRRKLHYLNAAPINDIADRWMGRYDRARARALADLKHALEDDAMSNTEFVYVTYINTTPQQLWRALTDPAFTTQYFGSGGPKSDWKVGSTVLWSTGYGAEFHDWGQKVLEAEPNQRLSYTWHNYEPEMRQFMPDATDAEWEEMRAEPRAKVTFDIESTGDETVKLTVTHDGFAPDSKMLQGISQGWPGILSSLKSVLETGKPLDPASM
ncbi:MAG TPA: metalloregulator ArsR/SmtB family transcription factor [Stackebrandtia sp.]|jgi:uncharacterized protein YndB with AHSA1/START domain|uniref:ArsR/SmtB family transcription factor n=1 Tax=Stackebrandtia sp. TaxID=2023065 RepID=UPI002D701CCD|nr:metalloregulator ArsR/SmtB family transcription factor [Stackebrandtia sp.]HZE42031.1 metalloregulator ArsR/SmtB family transcription factor [Stackebrandtia sp.]